MPHSADLLRAMAAECRHDAVRHRERAAVWAAKYGGTAASGAADEFDARADACDAGARALELLKFTSTIAGVTK